MYSFTQTNNTNFFSHQVSLLKNLDSDPNQEKFYPNNKSRPVSSGHYVLVKPTPLNNSKILHYSADLMSELGLKLDESLVKYLSGNLDHVQLKKNPGYDSIMGNAICIIYLW